MFGSQQKFSIESIGLFETKNFQKKILDSIKEVENNVINQENSNVCGWLGYSQGSHVKNTYVE